MPLRPDDPILAVVSPPRVDRLRELAGLAPDDPVTADFAGWSKLVLLTEDLALLFPRDHTQVEPLQRELEALRAVAAAGLAEVPEVVAVWEDVGISPHPVAAIRRLPGTILEGVLDQLSPEALGRLVEQVARLAARWHEVDASVLADRPPRGLSHRRALDEILDVHRAGPDASEVVARIGSALGLSRDEQRRAREAVRRARTLDPVFAHGDVHEGQLLVDPTAGFAVTGILDWQTAVVDHPFSEFDLGEWGPTIWRLHRTRFPMLRSRYWNAYASARDLPRDLASVFEWAWVVSHASWLASDEPRPHGPDVTGSVEEALERVHEATRELVV